MIVNRYSCPYLLLISSLFIIFSCNKNQTSDPDTLAIIGEKTISKQAFVKRYQDFLQRTGATDNGEARRAMLQNCISEELLVIEAKNRDYDKDSHGIHQLKSIEMQALLNEYLKKEVADNIEIKEDELKELYIRFNTKLEARHLYAPNREKAELLHAELKRGKTFEELALTVFDDPVLKNSGGFLGEFTVDEMDPAFEDAAFELKIGEISEPVRTKQGYSIIRVDNRVTQPFNTEYEYAKKRDKLKHYWKTRKIKKGTFHYVASLREKLNIHFNENTLNKLYDLIKEENKSGFSVESQLSHPNIKHIENELLVNSDLGKWDVKTFQEKAEFTSEKQKEWIRNKDDLKDFVAGLVIRTYNLKQAQQLGLNETPRYKSQVAKSFENFLLTSIQEALYNEIEISESEALTYFNENPQRFAEPAKVNLSEIVLEKSGDTLLISKKLNNRQEFSKLARQHSVRRWSAENGGELGYLSPQDLGKWSALAFSIETGEWTGPVRMESYYVYLKCNDKIPSRPRNFDEAKDEVVEALKVMAWEDTRNKKLSEIKKENHVVSYPERLRNIRLN
jgi:parvulin-like peptidyl-prolyl isomerase